MLPALSAPTTNTRLPILTEVCTNTAGEMRASSIGSLAANVPVPAVSKSVVKLRSLLPSGQNV